MADPATFLALNSLLGPYSPLRTAHLLSYGNNKYVFHHHLNVIKVIVLSFNFFYKAYTENTFSCLVYMLMQIVLILLVQVLRYLFLGFPPQPPDTGGENECILLLTTL